MNGHDRFLAGHLLVATPLIGTLPFYRSVVFIGEHDEHGALGLILNKPSELAVAEVLPDLAAKVSAPRVVHIGGPVQVDAAMVLAHSATGDFAMGTVFPDVGLVPPDDPPDDATDLRVFAGFSGWDAGQLEGEIATGSWWATPAHHDDLFVPDTDDLWVTMVRRLPGRSALYASFPPDPRWN
ncbi:MAG: YqgE/AlgH family protein [Acidimicrobiia bacterium]